MPNSSRNLPIAATNTGRIVGGFGVLACVLCCVSIPSIVAAISAAGLGFLRNDKLLLPAEGVSLVILLVTFVRSRTRHGRNAPIILGLLAAAWLYFGLLTPAPLGTIAALSGAVAVVAIVIWDWRLQRRCAAR
jgi:Na+/proline symporter